MTLAGYIVCFAYITVLLLLLARECWYSWRARVWASRRGGMIDLRRSRDA